MKLVRATNQSRLRNLRVKELGRIANEGETFNVTDERYEVLAKNNRFRVPFVILVQDLGPDEVVEPVAKKEVKPVKVEEQKPAIEIKADETPEIFVIEPGKEPVKVDENLEPIKEETVEPVEPKKKRNKKKKAEEVVE